MRPVERGFTMIELMVVMAIIIILTTMGVTQYRHSVIYARESVLKEDLFRMRDAIDQYFADKGQYTVALCSGARYKFQCCPFDRGETHVYVTHPRSFF